MQPYISLGRREDDPPNFVDFDDAAADGESRVVF
jgi:hypothetical protein